MRRLVRHKSNLRAWMSSLVNDLEKWWIVPLSPPRQIIHWFYTKMLTTSDKPLPKTDGSWDMHDLLQRRGPCTGWQRRRNWWALKTRGPRSRLAPRSGADRRPGSCPEPASAVTWPQARSGRSPAWAMGRMTAPPQLSERVKRPDTRHGSPRACSLRHARSGSSQGRTRCRMLVPRNTSAATQTMDGPAGVSSA